MKEPLKQPSRDTLTTVNRDGSRYFLHPADTRGLFTMLRRLSGWGLIALYVALPWIPVNGHPALFLDVARRQFHIFGLTLVPQDMWLAFFIVTGLGFFLFYVTSLFGRVWCGWTCPQTVFLEHVFRRVERLIDGDALAQRKLEQAPWTPGKVIRRAVKHGLFVLLALLVAHIALSYFVSLSGLYAAMQQAPWQNAGLFVLVFTLAGALYFNFAWFREQFCIILCPYGRFQSVLIDDHSLVIGYDEKRGEPRGKEDGSGDCVDCLRCVQVCPTGIDIRQGLQMECIGCSNCVDACHEVMQRLGRPGRLIRYDSLNGLNGRPTRWFRPRTIIYTVLLLAGATAMTLSFSTFRTLDIGITRLQGAPYYLGEGQVRNQYLLRLINKSAQTRRFHLHLSSPQSALQAPGFPDTVEVAAESEVMQPLVLLMPEAGFPGAFDFKVEVQADEGGAGVARQAEFLGPDPQTSP